VDADPAPAPGGSGGEPGPPFPLADLASDTQVAVLEALSAADLSRAAVASRLLFLLAKEVQRRPTLVVDVGAPSEVFARLRQRLVATPTIGFLFGTGVFEQSGVTSVLPKCLPPTCHIIGAETEELQALVPSTSAAKGPATELRGVTQRGQLAAMLGSFPDAVAQSFHISNQVGVELAAARDDTALAEALKRHHLPCGPDWGTIVLIVGRLSRDCDPEVILKGVQRCCPNAAILGGIAGNKLLRHAHGRTTIKEVGIVGMALKGNVPLTALVSRGCSPMTPPLRARGAQAEVFEEDGEQERVLIVPELADTDGSCQSSLKVVVEAQQAMRSKGRRITQPFAGYRLGADGGYTLEHIGQNSFGRGGEMCLPLPSGEAGPLPDCGVRFYHLDPDACRKDLRQLLGYVKKKCEDDNEEQTLGSIMFTCGGRRDGFFGDEFVDAKIFQEAFPMQPLVGFWAGGEIGPQALAEAVPAEATRTGRAALQGFTAVFGVFRAPPPPQRTWLALLAEDQVPAAVGEVFARLAQEAAGRAEAAVREGDTAGAELHRARAAALAAVPTAMLPADERTALLGAA